MMSAKVGRRWTLKVVAAAFAMYSSPGSTRAQSASISAIRFGAVRWDAWYGRNKKSDLPEWFAAHDLDPSRYHLRAPFFAKKTGVNAMSIMGDQHSLDEELIYASRAGIQYWVFLWYPHGRPIHLAWEYYQNSKSRLLVNWAILIGISSLAEGFPPQSDLGSLFSQSCYERSNGRPLLFILDEVSNELASARLAISRIRALSIEAGAGDPYVIVLSGVPEKAAATMSALGADAISAYASAPPTNGRARPYADLDSSVRLSWSKMAATGAEVVPNGMTGWDRRPRIQQPPPFDKSVQSLTMEDYFVEGTPEEIAIHVSALKQFIIDNPETCRAKIGLLYSWNECDEGGRVLCPTWTPRGADHSLLDSLRRVMS